MTYTDRSSPRMTSMRRLTPLAFLLLLLLLLLFAVYGCERKSAPQKAPEAAKPAAIRPEAAKPVEINLKEIRLAVIPEDYDSWSNVSFSADGRQVFYGAGKGGKKFVVVGNKPGNAIRSHIKFGSFER